jgi:predicted PurR-regulated permease PerM
VVSGLISFIPYVGSLTALVLSLSVALAQFAPDWARIVIRQSSAIGAKAKWF